MSLSDDVKVIQTPNSGPPLNEVWVFVSRDEQGQENTIYGTMPLIGPIQLMTGHPVTLEVFKRYARRARESLKGTGQTVHLLRFTQREEIEEWE